MTKKIVNLFIMIILIVAFSFMPTTLALADENGSTRSGKSPAGNTSQQPQTQEESQNNNTDPINTGGGGASFHGDCNRTFLGMTSWDCGVDISDETSLKTGIWQIVANIATDIIVAGAYLALGYVIYSGYLYMFSNGDSGKVAGAKKSLAHALIGLAMILSTSVIMGAIRAALLGGDKLNCDVTSGSGCIDPNVMVTNSIQWVIGIAGAVAVIFLVAGGISYITSGGESAKIQKAKQTILYALIGLGIVALAQVITVFVSGTVRTYAKDNGAIPTIIAAKSIKEGET